MRLTKRKDYIRRSYIGLLIGLLTLPLAGQTRPKQPAPDSAAQTRREYFYQGVLAQSSGRTMKAFDLLRTRAPRPTNPLLPLCSRTLLAQQL